jgi:hypothetical protein
MGSNIEEVIGRKMHCFFSRHDAISAARGRTHAELEGQLGEHGVDLPERQ